MLLLFQTFPGHQIYLSIVYTPAVALLCYRGSHKPICVPGGLISPSVFLQVSGRLHPCFPLSHLESSEWRKSSLMLLLSHQGLLGQWRGHQCSCWLTEFLWVRGGVAEALKGLLQSIKWEDGSLTFLLPVKVSPSGGRSHLFMH